MPPSVPTRCFASQLLCNVVWSHRVKFGPLGWNVTYNFGDADLDAAFKLLGRFVDDLQADSSTPTLAALPVESLVYVTGNITYGGWVTDEWDRRCLLAVLDHFYSASIFGDAVRKYTSFIVDPSSRGLDGCVMNRFNYIQAWIRPLLPWVR